MVAVLRKEARRGRSRPLLLRKLLADVVKLDIIQTVVWWVVSTQKNNTENRRKANNTTSKYNEKTKDHVRQMKELTEERIHDWETVVERGAKEDVQSLNGWLHPLTFHKVIPISMPPHE